TFEYQKLGKDVAALKQALSGDFGKKLLAAEKPMIIVGSGVAEHPDSKAFFEVIGSFVDKNASKLLTPEWNAYNVLQRVQNSPFPQPTSRMLTYNRLPRELVLTISVSLFHLRRLPRQNQSSSTSSELTRSAPRTFQRTPSSSTRVTTVTREPSSPMLSFQVLPILRNLPHTSTLREEFSLPELPSRSQVLPVRTGRSSVLFPSLSATAHFHTTTLLA